jgi:hypothetical protein
MHHPKRNSGQRIACLQLYDDLQPDRIAGRSRPRGGISRGLPLGVQIVAQHWREDLALEAGQAIEIALGGWQPPPR